MSTLLSRESQTATVDSLSANISNPLDRPKMTKCYQADQQVKYLHLQAEIEVLIQELQTLKHKKYLSELPQ